MSLGVEFDVDLDQNQADASVSVHIDKLFVNNEIHLWEHEDDWEGLHVEGDVYYYVDTTLPESDFVENPGSGSKL